MFKINDVQVAPAKRFGDGASHYIMPVLPPLSGEGFRIEWKYRDESDVQELAFIVLWLRERFSAAKLDIELFIPYLPHARMDKTTSVEEIPALRYMAQLLSLLGVKRVTTLDVHNPKVTADLFASVGVEFVNQSVASYVEAVLEKLPSDLLVVFPDKGAKARYCGLFKDYPIAYCDKVRNPETGKIEGLTLAELPVGDFNAVLVVDDIISYGGTLLRVGQAIRDAGVTAPMYVYASHVEDSVFKGELLTSGLYERVYTLDTIQWADAHKYRAVTTQDGDLRVIDAAGVADAESLH